MRKLLLILLALLLSLTFAITGFAQTADLVLSDVEAKPGDTVYLTVELKTQLTADAMGLSYSYDEKILSPMPADSWSWEIKGAISNFDVKKDRAVWGANEPMQLQGDICVMAFRVLEVAKLSQTKVTCELIIKNQGEEVGVYTAEGVVGQHCDHEYGPWDSQDTLWHTAQCTLCGKTLTQSHMWDDGVQTTVDGKALMRFTCTVCRETRDVKINNTEGHETKPTGDPEDPSSPSNSGSKPNQNTDQHPYDENIWETISTAPDGDDHKDHDHQPVDDDAPTAPENEVIPDPTEHTHEHTHEELLPNQNDPVTGIVVAVALAIMLGVAVFIVKKK